MEMAGRTDLASEAHRIALAREGQSKSLPGVVVREEVFEGLPLTWVEILDAEGQSRLGKPPGRYATLKLPSLSYEDALMAAQSLAALIRSFMVDPGEDRVCLAALGNPNITPDALGPLTAEGFLVTRHLKQAEPDLFAGFRSTSLCRPGVLGASGFETAKQVAAFCHGVEASMLIVVDALAGCELSGLCHSIQVCDTGLSPGSGVGNNRAEISPVSLGIPVLALGVPTVIDASALQESEELRGLFVTPRDIDTQIRSVARILAAGLNMALHEHLEMEEMRGLMW